MNAKSKVTKRTHRSEGSSKRLTRSYSLSPQIEIFLSYAVRPFINASMGVFRGWFSEFKPLNEFIPALKLQNTTTSLLFSKTSTGSKYLNESNTKQNHSPITHFNPLKPSYLRQLFTIQPSRSMRSSSALTLLRLLSPCHSNSLIAL